MLLIIASLLTFFELYFSLINKYILLFLHTVIVLMICEDKSSKAICLNENVAPIIIIFLSARIKFKIFAEFYVCRSLYPSKLIFHPNYRRPLLRLNPNVYTGISRCRRERCFFDQRTCTRFAFR